MRNLVRILDTRILDHCRSLSTAATITRWLIVALTLTIAGCADLQTVSRRTEFPTSDTGKGLAIHLDAQQRLVLAAGGKYCAEPSPDALAAYASSLGLGISAANGNSASTASALQSSAGSIGLRTQSITLMRDSLYRLCEASMNGTINSLQVAEFLRRSQDLTAVILAIEQLTGAVAANQVTLTSSGTANASAQLLTNQQALQQARDAQTAAQTALQKAQTDFTTAGQQATTASNALSQAQTNRSALNNATPPATPDQISAADAAVQNAQNAASSANADLASARQQRDSAQISYDEAVQVTDLIQNARDAAVTSSSASTAGNAQMSVALPRNQLDAASTVAIASAVNDMVKSVLDKDYSVDTCLTYLTGTPESAGAARAAIPTFRSIKEACLYLIAVRATTQAKGSPLNDTELQRISNSVHADLRGQ